MLEIAVDGRTWCGMCPLSVAAEAYVRTSQRTRKLSKCFHPTCFSFLHTISSQHTFLPVRNFPQVFPSTKLSSINHDSHLHLSGFTPLRKIPSVNHYFRNQDFQQRRFVLSVRGFRVSFLLTFSTEFMVRHGNTIATFVTGFVGSLLPIVIKAIIDHRSKVANPEAPTVEQRLAAINGRLGPAGQGDGTVIGRITAMERRITAVEGRIATLVTTIEGVAARVTTLEGVPSLEARVTTLEGRLAALERGTIPQERVQDLEKGFGRVPILEGQVGKLGEGVGEVPLLGGRVAAVEATLGPVPALQPRVRVLEEAVITLRTEHADRISRLEGSTRTITALASEVDNLRKMALGGGRLGPGGGGGNEGQREGRRGDLGEPSSGVGG